MQDMLMLSCHLLCILHVVAGYVAKHDCTVGRPFSCHARYILSVLFVCCLQGILRVLPQHGSQNSKRMDSAPCRFRVLILDGIFFLQATVQAALAGLPNDLVNAAYKRGTPMWNEYHVYAQDTLAICVFAIIICGTFGMVAIRWFSPLLLERVSFLLPAVPLVQLGMHSKSIMLNPGFEWSSCCMLADLSMPHAPGRFMDGAAFSAYQPAV